LAGNRCHARDGDQNPLLARRERASRVTVCGFLVDVYCLGVKNVTGPEVMGAGSLQAYARSCSTPMLSGGRSKAE
jgi:hypothetical protein